MFMKKMSLAPHRVLVVDDIHPVFAEILTRSQFIVDYKPDIEYNTVLSIVDRYEVLILRSKFNIGKELLDRAVNLQLIGRAGAGVDNIDRAYAESCGVSLVSAPEGNCDAVAEHMLGMLLGLMNNLFRGNFQVRNQVWEREGNRGVELGGKTVGLIGYGNNGKAMAKKLSGFDVNVLAYDKYLRGFSDAYATQCALGCIMEESDILSLHVPLTEETREWVNQSFLDSFIKPFYLLNGSRGEIVQPEALVHALKTGKVIGAAVDVLPVERFPALTDTSWYSDLLALDQVVFSPHIAGWSTESYQKISKVLAEKVRLFYNLAE